jgi:hypothetical protein
MTTRFITNAFLGLAGAFLVVASLAFAPTVTAWLALAVAIGVIVITAAAQLDRSRGTAQRSFDGVVSALAVVTLVFSLVLTHAAVMWLSFAFGLGFVALAYIGLAYNEIAEWRLEHGLSELHGLRLVQRTDDRKAA